MKKNKNDIINGILKNNKRVDVGFSFLMEILLKNNRFEYYDLYIKFAKRQGYILTSYIDYIQNYAKSCKKVLILRHDVDYGIDNTKIMFKIEKDNGVKATYYYRWCTFDKELIRSMDTAGFEVGLHYETLGKFCFQNNIDSVTEDIILKCREKLKLEIQKFKEQSGVDIKTIANHGHPKNLEMGVSNNVLVEGMKYSDFGVISEAYDEKFYQKVNTHIMDTQVAINYGFSYRSNPIESILNDDKLIVFLSHPGHWKYNFYERFKLLAKIVLKKYTTSTTRQFIRINKK